MERKTKRPNNSGEVGMGGMIKMVGGGRTRILRFRVVPWGPEEYARRHIPISPVLLQDGCCFKALNAALWNDSQNISLCLG
jgi:hypothetical protein